MFCFFSLSTQRKVYILFSAQGKIFPGFCAEKVFSSSLSAQRKAFSPQWECFFLLSVQIKCISFCFLWREFFFFVSFSTQRKCFPCFLKSKRFSISTQRNASIFFSVLHRQKLFFLSYRTEKGFPRFLCRERFFSWVLHNEKFFFFLRCENLFSSSLHRGKFWALEKPFQWNERRWRSEQGNMFPRERRLKL